MAIRSSNPIGNQTCEMESTGAYRASGTVVWLWQPIISHIMLKGRYFGATVSCVVGPIKEAASSGFGST